MVSIKNPKSKAAIMKSYMKHNISIIKQSDLHISEVYLHAKRPLDISSKIIIENTNTL